MTRWVSWLSAEIPAESRSRSKGRSFVRNYGIVIFVRVCSFVQTVVVGKRVVRSEELLRSSWIVVRDNDNVVAGHRFGAISAEETRG